MGKSLHVAFVIFMSAILTTSCAGIADTDFQRGKGEIPTAFGLLKVRTSGTYSRGYETQLRFFHLKNRTTGERLRANVQSSGRAFDLALDPGDYEVIRVQINEGPMMMESHVSFRFKVPPNAAIYLGNWEFDVDTPRTQRMLRIAISPEMPAWKEFALLNRSQQKMAMKASIPELNTEEVRLYTVAPYTKISYYYR